LALRFKQILAATLVLAALAAAPAQARKAPRRIVFARGATVASGRGYLRGIRDEAWFVLRVKSGQHLRIEIAGKGPTRGSVVFPSGKQDGGPGGVIYDGFIDESGNYKIRVTESSMAEAWRGHFTLTVRALPVGQQP